MGGLLTESFFGIPGLGAYMMDAIASQDFPAIVRAMVFLGSVLYILSNMVDLAYTWADPRVRMQ